MLSINININKIKKALRLKGLTENYINKLTAIDLEKLFNYYFA